MVEMILAGVIVALVAVVAAATGVRERRRGAERPRPPARQPPYGEPIPGGWAPADERGDGCDRRWTGCRPARGRG